MTRKQLYTLVLLVILAIFGLLTPASQVTRAAAALPPLPSETIRNQVINNSGPVTMTPMGEQQFLVNDLAKFTMAPFAGITLDQGHMVHYTDMNRTILQTLVPRTGAQYLTLAPNTVTPGDNKPALVIGGYFDIAYGSGMLVAVWTSTTPGAKPSEVRLYQIGANSALSYVKPYSDFTLKYDGVNGQQSPGDVGALAARSRVCFAIGLDQMCLGTSPNIRDSSLASLIDAAKKALSNAYSYSANFNHSDGVPDLVGANYRNTCKTSIQATTTPGAKLANCLPNIILVANDHPNTGEPLALFNVIGPNDLKVYDTQGNFVGGLPIGYYLVMDATPSNVSPTPGNKSVFFLVNADTQHHYLLPNVFIEGFGRSPTGTSLQVSAIKDGTTSGHGF